MIKTAFYLSRKQSKKYDEKILKNEIFSGKSLSINVWVMAKVLHNENKLSTKHSNVELSLQSGQLVDYDLQSVYEQAKKYINE